MPDNIRYAIARDPKINTPSGAPQFDKTQRTWWQLKRDDFAEWDGRRLFVKDSTALAIIWKYRDMYEDRFKYTLVKVTRKALPGEEIVP